MRLNPHIFMLEHARAALRAPAQFLKKRQIRACPICGYRGRFLAVGPRPESRCPNCSSKERDRIMGLYLRKSGISMEAKHVLHFSPERPFFRKWKDNANYVAGDVKRSKVSNALVDITNIQFGNNTFDYVICHHVLEHVDEDMLGMQECFRVLKPGGLAFFSVPLDITREQTWEPSPGISPKEIEQICGWDHVRLYGRDFRQKLESAGFVVNTIPFSAAEADLHRLSEVHALALQGLDLIFVGEKKIG